ncbi:GNAT family N-acetyltransferase [soil metagenome]
MTVRDATADDEGAWRELWAGYLGFYGERLSDAVTDHTWTRILDPASPLRCRVATHQGRVAGFAVVVLHEGSWTLTPIAYLEDLFVDPELRGTGLGRALIEDLVVLAKASGWSRLYWHTAQGNTRARRLYDAFFPADDHVRYRLFL